MPTISNITHLRGLAFSPDPSIIRELERLLEEAKRGEILGLAGVVEYPGQWRAVAIGAVQRDCGPYIGWTEILQQEMVDVHREAMANVRRSAPPTTSTPATADVLVDVPDNPAGDHDLDDDHDDEDDE